jgi:hypothetical protein
MSDRESQAKREQRAREIREELDRLDRGIFPERIIGKWGTVSPDRLARLKESHFRELAEITRADRATSDARSFHSYKYRAANLRELGLGPDGWPLDEAACRTPCSLARWPRGRSGSEWAAGVGSPRYSDRGLDCKL